VSGTENEGTGFLAVRIIGLVGGTIEVPVGRLTNYGKIYVKDLKNYSIGLHAGRDNLNSSLRFYTFSSLFSGLNPTLVRGFKLKFQKSLVKLFGQFKTCYCF
jgi:hypothetical protein